MVGPAFCPNDVRLLLNKPFLGEWQEEESWRRGGAGLGSCSECWDAGKAPQENQMRFPGSGVGRLLEALFISVNYFPKMTEKRTV